MRYSLQRNQNERYISIYENYENTYFVLSALDSE